MSSRTRLGAHSQQRAAAVQAAGIMDAEIAPITVIKIETDKATGETREVEVTVTADEGIRTGTTAEALAGLRTVL